MNQLIIILLAFILNIGFASGKEYCLSLNESGGFVGKGMILDRNGNYLKGSRFTESSSVKDVIKDGVCDEVLSLSIKEIMVIMAKKFYEEDRVKPEAMICISVRHNKFWKVIFDSNGGYIGKYSALNLEDQREIISEGSCSVFYHSSYQEAARTYIRSLN